MSPRLTSGHSNARGSLSQPGQSEKRRSTGMYSYSTLGRRVIVVSIMDRGAGSVAVSARPILPWVVKTSGKRWMILSVCCSNSFALVIEMPGKVVGM